MLAPRCWSGSAQTAVSTPTRHPRHARPGAVGRAADRAASDDTVVTWSGDRLVEISAASVTKATALRRFCQRLGVAHEEVIAFGDMPNDLAMLAWAGRAVAVASAQQNVLDAADEITASNLDDGVAQVLERLVAERATPRPTRSG
jgi:hydroxymethylpyrimidine pyrophosphatase-like HAD family hydrolase